MHPSSTSTLSFASAPQSTWTPERLDKAKRLVRLTHAEIARSLGVQAFEVERIAGGWEPEIPSAAEDNFPPTDAPAPVKAATPVAAEQLREPDFVPAPAAPMPVTLPAARMKPSRSVPVNYARTGDATSYRLRDRATGQYLNIDCSGMTRDANYSWIGSGKQLRAVRRRWPEYATLAPVEVTHVR